MTTGTASKLTGKEVGFDRDLRKLVETPLEEHTGRSTLDGLVKKLDAVIDEAPEIPLEDFPPGRPWAHHLLRGQVAVE